jgi:hypothetical protein
MRAIIVESGKLRNYLFLNTIFIYGKRKPPSAQSKYRTILAPARARLGEF